MCPCTLTRSRPASLASRTSAATSWGEAAPRSRRVGARFAPFRNNRSPLTRHTKPSMRTWRKPVRAANAELRRKGENVGLATVYRHLQALAERGSVDAIRDASGETLYRQCETSVHHHHLTCRSCGRSVEVEGRAVEQWAERVAEQAGFTEVNHTVEMFGLCPGCAAARR